MYLRFLFWLVIKAARVIASGSDSLHDRAQIATVVSQLVCSYWRFHIINPMHTYSQMICCSILSRHTIPFRTTVVTLCIVTPISWVLIEFHAAIELWTACGSSYWWTANVMANPMLFEQGKNDTILFSNIISLLFLNYSPSLSSEKLAAVLFMQINSLFQLSSSLCPSL